MGIDATWEHLGASCVDHALSITGIYATLRGNDVLIVAQHVGVALPICVYHGTTSDQHGHVLSWSLSARDTLAAIIPKLADG